MTTLRFNGPIAFDTADGRGVPVEVLDGAHFVSIQAAADGNVEFVYLDSGNVEQTFLIELVQTTTGLNLEQVQDAVAALLAEGDNVTLTYDDAAGTLTIAATGGGGGGGTDQTARDAALAAQQAADTAQGAADTAQGGVDTHGASTHNTDTTARNRGATARTEAQQAQATVDGHIANHPGNGGGNGTPHTEQRVLQQDPMGSAATLGKFQIDPTGNAYGTVPDTELGVLATGDFTVFNHADYAGELDFETERPIIPAGRALLPDRRPQAAGYDCIDRLPGYERMGRW